MRHEPKPQTQKAPAFGWGLVVSVVLGLFWLRGLDLNQRPSGYEPDELPGCSTPRHHFGLASKASVSLPCVFWI